MLKAALLNGLQFHVQHLHIRGERKVGGVLNGKPPVFNDGNFLVVEVDHFIGVFDDRGGVRSQEKLVLANPNDQRAALSGRDEHFWVLQGHDHNGISAHNFCEGQPYRFVNSTVFVFLDVFDKVDEDLSIGIALESMAFVYQVLLEGGIIFDNAVVDDRQLFCGRVVGVCVAIGRLPMRCPAGVPHPDMAFQVKAFERGLQFGHPSPFFVYVEAAIHQCDPRTVVTTVLKPLQPFYDHFLCLSRA